MPQGFVLTTQHFVSCAVSLALILPGCTVSPGSYVPSNRFETILGSGETSVIEATRIKITPEVVNRVGKSKRETPHITSATLTPPQSHTYLIGTGDVLSVVVWDHPELTAPFGSFNNAQDQGNVVREDGTIYYPFVGAIGAVGRSALQVRDEMELRLATYIESPQVDVRVASYRSQRFFVSGSGVKTPGGFPITDVPVTIVDAINMAGGLRDQADLFDVRLSREGASFVVPLYDILFEGDTSGNVVLTHGDILHVAPNERRQVLVLGEVLNPQSVPLTNRPMSLAQALASVGGIQEARADGRGIYVIRSSEYDGIVDVYQLDMSRAWALALGGQFMMEAGDVVYVSAAPITRWNRWVSNVLPSLQGLFNIDRVGRN